MGDTGLPAIQAAAFTRSQVRVALIEDKNMMRAAISALLDLEEDIDVVADVASGSEIVEVVKKHAPDVVILDVDLPTLDGIAVAGQLRELFPGLGILILTALDRPGTLRRALNAGVNGFILKDADPAELVQAVRAVSRGQRYVDLHFVSSAWEDGLCPLTRREVEVLASAARGLTTEEIALVLSLARGTVRNYLSSSVTKLNGRNRIDAIRIAKAAGWL